MIQMNEFKRIKILALQSILFSMEAVKDNIENNQNFTHELEKGCKAMKDLAEAFHLVKGA